jgi:hypothetical protein
MTYTATTHAEAKMIAKQLRGYGYRVEIVKPLFKGDSYHINVTP